MDTPVYLTKPTKKQTIIMNLLKQKMKDDDFGLEFISVFDLKTLKGITFENMIIAYTQNNEEIQFSIHMVKRAIKTSYNEKHPFNEFYEWLKMTYFDVKKKQHKDIECVICLEDVVDNFFCSVCLTGICDDCMLGFIISENFNGNCPGCRGFLAETLPLGCVDKFQVFVETVAKLRADVGTADP